MCIRDRVTPVAPGTATVTATSCNGKSASCTVTIIAPQEMKPVLPDTEGKTQVVVEPEIRNNTVDADAVKAAIANAKPEEAVVVKVETKSGEEIRDIQVDADVVEQAAKAASDGLGAVSYTHLDVYKRQEHDHGSGADGRSDPGGIGSGRPDAADAGAYPSCKAGRCAVHHRIYE